TRVEPPRPGDASAETGAATRVAAGAPSLHDGWRQFPDTAPPQTGGPHRLDPHVRPAGTGRPLGERRQACHAFDLTSREGSAKPCLRGFSFPVNLHVVQLAATAAPASARRPGTRTCSS